MKRERLPQDLRGRVVAVFLGLGREKAGRHGYACGRVIRVDAPRGELRGATIRLTGRKGRRRFQGARVRVNLTELTASNQPVGVISGRRVIPIGRWLEGATR